jgi:hypothetical protein
MYQKVGHAKHSYSNDVFLASASGEGETPDFTSVLEETS